MMSGILNRRGLSGATGTRRAKGLPALVISTDSPSSIHAATRGKRFRKSLTVAVFIVRLMCLTASRLATAFKGVRRGGAYPDGTPAQGAIALWRVRGQAKRDPALDQRGTWLVRHREPKRRRRCALPAHSKWWYRQDAPLWGVPNKRPIALEHEKRACRALE